MSLQILEELLEAERLQAGLPIKGTNGRLRLPGGGIPGALLERINQTSVELYRWEIISGF